MKVGQNEDLYRILTAGRLLIPAQAVTLFQQQITKGLLQKFKPNFERCTQEQLAEWLNKIPLEIWGELPKEHKD